MSAVEGIDTSHWNTWPNIKPHAFVWIKATEGNAWEDPTFTDRLAKLRATDKIVGLYHFLTVGIDVDQQASWFNRVANPQPGDVLGLDFEWDEHWRSRTNPWLAAWAMDAMNTLADMFPHNRSVLYCNRTVNATIIEPYSVPLNDGLWLASPGAVPRVPWVFWQYGSTTVDLDRANFATVADFRDWAFEKTVTQSNQQFQLLNQ